MSACSFEGCSRRCIVRGYCNTDYQRLLRRGELERFDRRRLDFAPLDDASASVLADRYQTTRRSIVRYRRDGIPAHTAERFADLLGCHPCELWSDFYESVELRGVA
jgi:hypothetical protein